jgi:hypothetical protein
MKTTFIFSFVCFFISCVVNAESLQFTTPLSVTSVEKNRFIHLDSGGRRLIATSDDTAAVVWEDNHSGQPTIYIAYLMPESRQFTPAQIISGKAAAYEPVIVGLEGKRFLVGWEESDRVWLRVMDPGKEDTKSIPATKISSRHISVAAMPNGKTAAVWVTIKGKSYTIQYSSLQIKGQHITLAKPVPVDNSKDRKAQLYPVVELTKQGSVVAWEDRRQGVTRIFSAFAPQHKSFDHYQFVNEFTPSPNPDLGRGTGSMRAALASDKNNIVTAVWMDKRNWRSGYDVFADISTDGGKTFNKDEIVQDMFAENVPQWHATITMHSQKNIVAVAWDDTRNDNPDIFYSLRVNNEWSEDYELPGAAESGAQTHPSIVFDDRGILHAIWLDNASGWMRLMYTRSR